ncbi:hypothetical protein [Niveibacterium terrae]|uniref:hypothetical protein n=1 Tax=Niveibacterium terrae TaxID=3373598 RepID=UPI003A942CEF
MLIRAFIYLVIFVGAYGLVWLFGVDYHYGDLKDYIGLLSSVSSMVFTIMGIWIALLYPNALNRIVDPKKIEIADFSETREETKRLERIVAAVLQSAVVLMVALLVMAAKTALVKTGFYVNNAFVLKSLALSAVAAISAMQVDAVLSVVFANVMFINDLHRKRLEKRADQDI